MHYFSSLRIDPSFVCRIEQVFQEPNPPNSIVALVGQSGAGKSTFVKFIPRFYDIKEGFISIDGLDIRDLDIIFLCKQIALVPQEPILLSYRYHRKVK